MEDYLKHEEKVYEVACLVADGISGGNETYEEMSEIMKQRCTWAADIILRHFILVSRET